MARPRGKRLHLPGLRYVLRKEGITLTEAATRCGLPLTTLSGLAKGDHRASDKVIRALTDGLGLEDDSFLFPELAGFHAGDRELEPAGCS